MAKKETKVIEIKVAFADGIRAIAQGQEAIKNLTAEQKQLNLATAEGVKRNAEITASIKSHRDEINQLMPAIAEDIKKRGERASAIDRHVQAEVDLINKAMAKRNQEIAAKEKEYARFNQRKVAEAQKENEAAVAKEQSELKKQNADKRSDVLAAVSAKKKEGYINQLKITVDSLEQEYYQLTEAELKSAKGTELLGSLKNKRAELMQLQQAYGNHQLNVGNYSSATKMLGINIGQVMKELPNFAISTRIGIMSLTNNLPMLMETVKALRVEQIAAKKAQEQLTAAQLAALPNGGKLPSMFSLITRSVFGLTGVMSLLMVAFQLWGADLVQWIGGLMKAKEATDNFTMSQKALIKVSEGSGSAAKSQIENIIELGVRIKKYGDDSKYAKNIIDDFNTTFGTHYATIQELKKEYPELAKSFIQSAIKMAASQELISQASQQLLRQQKAQVLLSGFEQSDIDKSKQIIKDFFEWRKETLISGGMSEIEATKDNNKLFAKVGQEGFKSQRLFMTKQTEWMNNYILKSGNMYNLRPWFESLNDNMVKGIINTMGSTVQINSLQKSIEELYVEAIEKADLPKKSIKDFDFISKIMEEQAKTNEFQMSKELDVLKANYEKKKKEAKDYIKYLEEQAKDGNKKAIAELATARQQEGELQKTMIERYAVDQNLIIEKYASKETERRKKELDKQNKNLKDAIDKGKELLEDGLLDETALDSKSVENKEKLRRIDRQNEINALSDRLETTVENLDEQYRIEAEMRAFKMQEELAAEIITEEQKKIIRDKYAKLESDAQSNLLYQKQQKVMQYVGAIADISSNLNNFMNALGERELQNYSKQINGKANYDELYEAKKLELEIKAAKRGKALAIFGTIISTASSIMAAVAAPPVGLGAAGVPLAILNGINGAAQIAAILATPLPSASGKAADIQKKTVTEKFHTGGTNTAQTGVETPATLLGGESVNTIATTQMFSPLLSALNQLGGGKAITSGVANTGLGTDMLASAFSKALRNMPAPILIMEEFEKASEKHKKIQNNRIIR